MINWKEIAKFFSGVAAIEAINHIYLALSNVLPWKVLGFFTLTQHVNYLILIIWLFLFMITFYYAWIKK